ncbi:MAG: protein kinase [Verrucomicrobiota bacterium]
MMINRNQQIAGPAVRALLKPFTSKERYQEAGAIGEGGVSCVVSRFDSYLKRIVAVKELKEEFLHDPELMNAFIEEARMISYLEHPGVVTVYDTHLPENQQLHYSMELLEGQTLFRFLEHHLKPEVVNENYLSDVLSIFSKLCETLAYVHDKGVIHLDLKPANVMLGHYGEVKIMDWGNAKLYDDSLYQEQIKEFVEQTSEIELVAKKGKSILGTPQYMSPEQTLSREGLGPTSDLFSLGVVMYELLTGQRPFTDSSVEETVKQVQTLVPPAVHELNPDIPMQLSKIIEKMMAKQPEDRYQTAHDILDEIQSAQTSGQAFPVWEIGAGQVIFREGDPGDFTVRIKTGRVEISKEDQGSKKVLAELGAGDVLGELAVFSNMPRNATATALEDTVVYLMRSSEVRAEMDKMSPWVSQMITALSHRFDRLNKRVIELEKRG